MELAGSGNEAHFIPVGKKGFLAWQSTYKAKTSPGTVPAVAGGASGKWIFSKKGHMVKGITARDWTNLIYKKWKDLYRQRMANRMNEQLKGIPQQKISRLGW